PGPAAPPQDFRWRGRVGSYGCVPLARRSFGHHTGFFVLGDHRESFCDIMDCLAIVTLAPADAGEVACRNSGGSMQETLNSLVRLSAAMTIFGVQQVQSAVGSAGSKDSADRLREVIDGMAAAVSAQIDESKLPALDSISSLGHNVVGGAWESTTGIVKTTSDWLQGIVKAATPVPPGPEGR